MMRFTLYTISLVLLGLAIINYYYSGRGLGVMRHAQKRRHGGGAYKIRLIRLDRTSGSPAARVTTTTATVWIYYIGVTAGCVLAFWPVNYIKNSGGVVDAIPQMLVISRPGCDDKHSYNIIYSRDG